ncbi:MAG: helix-turn-helix transcriptional regulator [Flavobacteriales bacterium]|nr:helix-turn-helix transcriptional regulator [Flavobacteriales bacterium]
MSYRIFIKNMVCPRCIESVKSLVLKEGLDIRSIRLGEVDLSQKPNVEQTQNLKNNLKNGGFEWLVDQQAKIIEQIKLLIIQSIHLQHKKEPLKLSVLLADSLNHEYTYLSKLFSSVEGQTIEKFYVLQKIEKVKELLFYNELSLSEIAWELNYSSVAHLSAQFRKETGMTPGYFRNLHRPAHKSLDAINGPV